MAGCVDDVDRVLDVVVGRDDGDPWSRDRGPAHDGTGRPCGSGCRRSSELRVLRRRRACAVRTWPPGTESARLGVTVEVSLQPFLAAGELLYQGPWVAERLVEFGDFLDASRRRDPPRRPRHLRGRPSLHRGGRVRGPATPAGAQGDRGPALGADGRPRRADRRDAPSPSPRCWPTRSDRTRSSGTTRTSATCSTSSASPSRSGTTADGRPASAMLLGRALSDDTVLRAGRPASRRTTHPRATAPNRAAPIPATVTTEEYL